MLGQGKIGVTESPESGFLASSGGTSRVAVLQQMGVKGGGNVQRKKHLRKEEDRTFFGSM